MACAECGAENRPDSNYCAACGNPLVALEGDQGVQDGDTVKCAQCDHMNASANEYCVSCGEPLPLSVASASSRPRRFAPAPRLAVFAGHSSTAYDGIRSRGLLMARESFDAIDPRSHVTVHVKAGRTHIASDHWLLKVRPDAFQFA